MTLIDQNTLLAAATAPPPRFSTLTRATAGERALAASLLLLAAGILALAGSLRPASAGHGTHTQIGLSQCASEMLWHKPCPTCGMTTAFACFVRGDVIGALRAQVLGAVLAAATLLTALGAAVTLATGVSFAPVLRRIFIERIAWLYLLAGLALGSWAFKAWVTG